eukprot:SAG22_NODE_440_length_10484_cov_19.751661_9_plen_429_part_00
MPTYLKWMLVFEEPEARTLWLAKATPRDWLLPATKEPLAVERATTRYGRISFSLAVATAAPVYTVAANVTVPASFAAAASKPAGGLVLRIRAPVEHAGKLSKVTVGGQVWSGFDAAEETVSFKASELTAELIKSGLPAIVATFGAHRAVDLPLKTDDPRCPPPRSTSVPARTTPGCDTDFDCSLGGECVAGKCKCDPAWHGEHCAELNLLPAKATAGYNPSANNSASWGGNPVLGEDGDWHFFGSEFTQGCDVGQWISNSQVIRAVSTTGPGGPYHFQEVVAPVFHHNANIAKAPDGMFLLAMLGNGTNYFNDTPVPPQQHCKDTEQAAAATAAPVPGCGAGCPWSYDSDLWHSTSVTGPWTPLGQELLPAGPYGAWDEFRSNPSVSVSAITFFLDFCLCLPSIARDTRSANEKASRDVIRSYRTGRS